MDDDGYFYCLPVSLADEFDDRDAELAQLLADTVYRPNPGDTERFDAILAEFNDSFSQYRLEIPYNLTFTDPKEG